MTFYEKQLETETVYNGLIVNVRMDIAELQNGNKVRREVVEHPGGVCVVAVTKDNKVPLVRQFRYTIKKEMLEIPAGKLERGEDPFECAVRELSEETGYTANEWIDLGVIYPSAGVYSETLHQYLALDLQPGEMHLDENELLSVEEVDLDELVDLIMANEMKDAKTIIGVLKAKNHLNGESISDIC